MSPMHQWPRWHGGNHPDVPFDKRWSPNHPEHIPGPWEGRTAGLNGDLPPNMRIEHFPNARHPGSGRVTAFDDDLDSPWHAQHGVSSLSWNPQGQIAWVQTNHEGYERRGIPTALLNHVRQHIRPDIHHSGDLSDSGKAWAESDPAFVPKPPTPADDYVPRNRG